MTLDVGDHLAGQRVVESIPNFGERLLRSVFHELEGDSFACDEDFQRAVIDAFNARLWSFPAGYSYLDAIVAAKRRGWLRVMDGGVVVKVYSGHSGSLDLIAA